MAKKMLGKVVAGAALGSASLLVFAPGAAYADGQAQTDEGKVFAKPHAVKAGEEVKLVQICPEEQEHPFVWSKVTGKVKLEPARGGDSRGDHKDWREENGAAEGADSEGWSGHERSQPAEAESGSGWGGGAADAHDDWKGEEHGQDAEAGDAKDHGKKDWKGQAEESDSAAEESTGGWSGRHENGADSAEHDWSGKGDWSDESGESEWSGKDDWSGESGERDWSGKGDWAAEEAEEAEERGWEHKKDFVYYGEAQVAEDAAPGTYKLEGSCGTGELVVLPNGGVDGGDGGIATGADRGLAAAGASLVGAAALGGLVLMRRRRVDEFAA
ncbi:MULTISPECIES: hypothetical protein [unclassified Micromonospora]|uniref:hypothetical protein n=1 Tax=unclassified Micromonospora TaxID=2617518 RepID=UPI0022B6EDC8|nr:MULTISPECIES: hypothetical protein [unclassified Micromonospora]MCZ7418756.1 hypothetical protein [Verrucosispora sp. WMMA2121]WBB92452.1 hypothetical protein O7597_05460 [Verrucosispora sp. WMMC514]